MSLKLPQKKGLPVLDSPSRFSGPKIFLTRRPLSVVGKPVLAEKHLPVQPSASPLARKCYCCDSEHLFRFRRKPAGNRKIRPGSATAPEPFLPFATRSVWTDEFPRQSLPQRSSLACCWNEKSPVRNQTALFIEPASISSRSPGMQVSVCQLKSCHCHTDRPHPGFKFVSDQLPRLYRIEKAAWSQINSTIGTFFSVLSSKKRWKKFACVSPVLKTFADYLTAPLLFFDGNDKRRPMPLKTLIPEAESTGFSMQTSLNRSTSQPVFTANIELLPEKRILDHEKHQNFVLENKIIFSPGFLRKKINLTHNQAFARSCPEKQRKFSNLPDQFSPVTPSESHNKPAGRIEKADPFFSVCSPKAFLQKERALPADFGWFSALYHAPRLRLRLRLQRQNFPATSLLFSATLPDATLNLRLPQNRRIPAEFPRMMVSPRYNKLFAVQSAFARVCIPADYRIKKASFMVRAARHAHYTLAQLRNIIVPSQSKRLTTTSLFFSAFSKIESGRFATSEKGCPKSKLDKADPQFKHQDVSLNLLGQNSTITSILASAMPRRVRPATPQPLPDMRIEPSPKRRKPLRQLRFKLHSISEGFVSSKLKPLKKIDKETSFFPLCTLAEKSLPAGSNERFVPLKTLRQPRLKPRLRLRRFALQQILPEQIKTQLQLEMKICSDSGSFRMPVRHFIIPALGAKSLRRFNCRISLLPHPFGFPAFSFSEPRFYSLSSQPVFTQHQPQTNKLHGTGSFILKKDQLFLPPLSMKNPRRLLYNHLNPALASKEFYLVGNLNLKGALCPAPRIADFLHTWLGTPGGCIVPRNEEKFHQRLRLKLPLINHLPESREKESYRLKSSDISVPRMVRINRLLLRARRFSTAVAKTLIAAETQPAAKLFRPCLPDPVLSRPAVRESQSRFSISNCEISQLQQKPVFNDDVAESFKSHYHARFRSFRFPWRPETRMSHRTIEQPAQPDTGMSVTAITLPDELRSTAFIFADAGANILPLPASFLQVQGSKPRHLSDISQSLSFERRLTLSEAAISAMQMQNPEKYLQQFINPETFFIMREKSRSRLKKNLRNYSFRNVAKTIQLRPVSEKYSEFGLKNRAVRRMPLEPLHWIIMMHSFLQPESPVMNYCLNLPGAVRKYRNEMQTSESLPSLAFGENHREKPLEIVSEPRITLWSMLTSNVRFSDLAFPVPAKSETREFSAGHTAMPTAAQEKTVDRQPVQVFATVYQASPVWQPVHNFTNNPIRAESKNRFIETAMFKVETRPGHAQVSIRHRPEEFKSAFVPEWIDQMWQRPVLPKK
ncbi:MAG TPA: hypothetical protein PKN29_04980 [Candidatus Ozemobacteraceae bacterium]|nr:hypothetical protein [Candidatus Ozemobacteraceae bacterium]